MFSAVAIGDMIMHNRRKRNEWLAGKQDETARLTAEARQAFADGSADPDQMLLLNRERAANEAEARRTGSTVKQADDPLGARDDGLSPIQLGGNGSIAPAQQRIQPAIRQTVGAAGTRQIGGPLDRHAERVVQDTQSWLNWLTGR